MNFKQWADETFGSRFVDEETLTYFRMSAAWESAILAEREACAKVAESIVTKQSKHINDGKPFYDHMYWEDIAAAIRARGENGSH